MKITPGLRRAAGLVIVIGIWLALAAIGGPKIGQLSSVQSNDQQNFLPAGAESAKAAVAAAAFAGTGPVTTTALVVFSADANVTSAQLASWQKFVAGVGALRIPDGRSLATFQAGAKPVLTPSADGQADLVVVTFDRTKLTSVPSGGQAALRPVVDALRTAATAAAAGGHANVAGPAALQADFSVAFAGIDGLLLYVTLAVVLLILVLVYRAAALPFVVLLSSVCALALAGLIVYHLAAGGTLKLNGQSQGILFILVIGSATDYGLLLTARFREELTRYEAPFTAMRRAWRACIEPIGASAGTVVLGLLCLLLSSLSSNRALGPIGAIGIGAAFLASITLLPALLLLGRWLFWPRIPRVRAAAVTDPGDGQGEAREIADGGSPDRIADPESGPPRSRKARRPLFGLVAAGIARHPRRTWIVTAVFLVAACVFLPAFRASGTAQTDVFLKPTDSLAGQNALTAHFPGGAGNPVIIIAPQAEAGRILDATREIDGVDNAVVGTGRGNPPVRNGNVQIQATLSDPTGTATARAAVSAIRDAVHKISPNVLVGGQTAVTLDSLNLSRHDLTIILPAILLTVFVMLCLLLRSILAPLLLTVATVLSFGAAIGVSAIFFNGVFDFPGSDPAIPLYAFVFLVALGVDYSIFLMNRAREETFVRGPRDGVLHSLMVTGGVITSAGLVLAATFAALSVIPILFLVQIAFLVAFGVLLDTLVVRTLLVPALALDLGRHIWWPSALSRKPLLSRTPGHRQ